MEIKEYVKESFYVIGKEGSTKDGEGFIQELWKETRQHIKEIKDLAKLDGAGKFVGFWGAMTDFSRSFEPWQDNFSQGLYLAGIEVEAETDAPEGWVKWKVPGYKYLFTKVENEGTFVEMITYLKDNNIVLVGAVHDFIDPNTFISYMYFPVEKL